MVNLSYIKTSEDDSLVKECYFGKTTLYRDYYIGSLEKGQNFFCLEVYNLEDPPTFDVRFKGPLNCNINFFKYMDKFND